VGHLLCARFGLLILTLDRQQKPAGDDSLSIEYSNSNWSCHPRLRPLLLTFVFLVNLESLRDVLKGATMVMLLLGQQGITWTR